MPLTSSFWIEIGGKDFDSFTISHYLSGVYKPWAAGRSFRSAWPSMYKEFDVPVSYSGIIFMIIALGTIISSLQSDRLTRKLGTGKVTAISVLMTAVALLSFFRSAIPILHYACGPFPMGLAQEVWMLL